MKIDSYMMNYHANSALFDRVASNVSSFDAARNYAKAKFNGSVNALNQPNKGYKSEAEFDAALREQTDEFEAFLIKSVLDISLKNKVSLFGKDASDEIYSSMYNDAISKALSGGMGFSELLFNFLKEKS